MHEAIELMLEFRDLKRRLGITSADFHHLAVAVHEGCGFFVTTDERHLLNAQMRSAMERYTMIVSPQEIVQRLG